MIWIKVKCQLRQGKLITVVFGDRELLLPGPVEPELLISQTKGVYPAPVPYSQAAAIPSP